MQQEQLEAYWMGFTPNRQFKKNPRIFTRAEGMYYQTEDNRQILDGIAGLWCVNAGHCRPRIMEAIQQQIGTLDYAPAFQGGHPLAFELAERLVSYMPGNINHVFFTNSGSESVETALKIALAYHQSRGDSRRTRLIGREKGYHGANFGGMSVGGIPANRKMFPNFLSSVDHLPHTLDIDKNAFSRGVPDFGAEKADALEGLLYLHDPSTVAAVIVEPVAGSGGVILPPKGYLKRLREICDKHGVLLIFDEVITGFGRLGKSFACEYFDVVPDILTTAKGLTSGAAPMGGVFVTDEIYHSFMQGPEHLIEFFHGYTFSGHPLSCAAALGALDTYEEENLFTRGQSMGKIMEDALHELRDCPNVIDIRNLGLIGAIELQPIAGEPTRRAISAFQKAFDKGVLIRTTGDIIALSPPLIIEENHIEQIVDTLRTVLYAIE